jgi:ribonuclease HI
VVGVSDPDLGEVTRREMVLLEPGLRRSSREVLALLHPEFVEFGASGRVWDATSIAGALEGETDADRITGRNFVPVRLSGDVVLLTYEAHRGAHVTLRSSVWVRTDGEWRMRFHQGTPAADRAG